MHFHNPELIPAYFFGIIGVGNLIAITITLLLRPRIMRQVREEFEKKEQERQAKFHAEMMAIAKKGMSTE